MKLKTITLALALLLAAANTHSALDYLRAAEGVSHSHAHVQRTGGEMVDDPNSDTGSSWINTTLTNVEETNRIPLKKNHGFHVQLMMFKLPAETKSIQVTMTHPPMTLPSGEVLQEQGGAIPAQLGMGLFPEASFTYTLDEDYELVEGDWVLTFSHQGEELFQITFTTYR
jgi:hypothetical protein